MTIFVPMEGNKKPIHINLRHIAKGIIKYGGIKDKELNRLITIARLKYVAYIFNDGRVLLVLPNEMGGLLYDNKEDVYNILEFQM